MPREFNKIKDESGFFVECECCGYPGRVSMFPKTHTSEGDRDMYICEVCANTHLSIAEKYPFQCPDTKLYKSIAMLGNMILEAIRKEESDNANV